MRISKDLNRFHLHDGTLNKIEYSEEKHTLAFYLVLAEDSPPEKGRIGRMKFQNVEQVQIPNFYVNKQISAEIINVKQLVENATQTREGIVWLVYIYDYSKSSTPNDCLVIEFLTTDFEWIEDGFSDEAK